MKLSSYLLGTFVLSATSVLAATPADNTGCANACGVDTAQCVNGFSVKSCDNNHKLGRWKPNGCDKPCYYTSDPFASLYLCGDGTYGIQCDVHSDDNCQTLIEETPEALTAFDHGCNDVVRQSFIRCYQCDSEDQKVLVGGS